MPHIDDFLSKNTIKQLDGTLPLVHSTKSYNLTELAKASGLMPRNCKNYNDEKLLYFFLGRPAYRSRLSEESPETWELPTCFIFDTADGIGIKRTVPFDSGAYSEELFPPYINAIPRANFESSRADASQRVISAVYGSMHNYIKGIPKSEKTLTEEFDLKITDAEILAVRRLAGDGSPTSFDDRRFSIEIQSSSMIDFEQKPPSAIILPTAYLEDKNIIENIEKWGADIINYDSYSLSMQMYYGIVFDKFAQYCKSKGFIP